jgi:hypothetical protein
MKEKFLQWICNHEWCEDQSVYVKERSGKKRLITTLKCTKCGKEKTIIQSVGEVREDWYDKFING